jgi:hypothetical protein
MKDRNDFIAEQLLRENIRKILTTSRAKAPQEPINEEAEIRAIARKLLKEKIAIGDEVPHEKTGINKLRDTLKKIVPQVRDDYLNLTTDISQRKSYIAHLINGIDNLLAPINTNIDAPEANKEEELDEEIEISVKPEEESDQEGFIDIGDDILPSEEEDEEEAIEVSDEEELLTRGLETDENDETGRNAAIDTFKQIQATIVSDFSVLANDEDREIYHDYLKTNLLLWRDRFEEVLTNKLPEPTTPEYEQEKAGVELTETITILEEDQGATEEVMDEASFNTQVAMSVFSDETINEQEGNFEYEVSLRSKPDSNVIKRFAESLYAGKRAAFLSFYSESELADMDLYLIKGQNAGFAIKDGDDIVSVHNNSSLKGLGSEFLRKAKEVGGTKLDHFDGFLSGLYRKYGFTNVYEVYQWSEEYKPKGWNYDPVDIFNSNTSIYAEAIENIANLDKEKEVRAEDDYKVTINPANKVLQYRYGRPDVIMRKL